MCIRDSLSLDNETVSVTAGTNASIGGITSTVRNGNPSFYRAIGMEGWTGYLNYMCPGYMQFGAAGDNADGQPGNIISPVLNIPAGYDMLLTFKVGIWAAAPDQGMVGICEKNDGFWISKGTLSKIVASTKSYVSLDIPAYTAEMGLDAFEYQCGHGVRLGVDKARRMAADAAERGILFSVHAPYYLSLIHI